MRNKNQNTFFQLNRFNFIPFIEGLDIFLNFSIVTFLSIFFLAEYDNKYSLPIIIFTICLSFFSRIFFIPLLKRFSYFIKKEKINCLYLLSSFYLIPVFLPSSFIVISFFIFIFCRFSLGILFSSVNFYYLNSGFDKNEGSYFIKYSLLTILGMVLGSFLYLFVDDLFSNNQLNEWAWKVTYLLLFLITAIISIILKFNNKPIYIVLNSIDSLDEQLSLRKVKKIFFENIHILISLLSFVFFSSNRWLPKFANPENMQFLEFNIVFIIVIFLITIFIFPLIKLVGKKRLTNFLGFSIVIICFISFFFEYSSSYSIDLLKFFIALVSSFSICIFFLNTKNLKDFGIINTYFIQNLYFLVLSIASPLLFYYFINNSISYNDVYLIIGMFFVVSLASTFYVKEK
tara:strand:+ start:124 stop:1326 length:1203 start_codon:yes stop_codon:yes gene_type:complete